jgi:hypothetical protein
MTQPLASGKSARFDLNEIAKSFPPSADTLLLDTYLTNEEAASSRVFRVYRPTPPHYHATCDEYLYVLSGRGTFWMETAENGGTFSPGQLLFFRRGEPDAEVMRHSIEAALTAPRPVIVADRYRLADQKAGPAGGRVENGTWIEAALANGQWLLVVSDLDPPPPADPVAAVFSIASSVAWLVLALASVVLVSVVAARRLVKPLDACRPGRGVDHPRTSACRRAARPNRRHADRDRRRQGGRGTGARRGSGGAGRGRGAAAGRPAERRAKGVLARLRAAWRGE